jgi:DNA invertase Pin-like site-specific DNA recombinase
VSEKHVTDSRRSVSAQPRFLDTRCCTDPAPAANLLTPELRADQSGVTGVLIGYARSSSQGENVSEQIDSLAAVGCHPIFTDSTSNRNASRPGLHGLLDYARPGDTVVVTSLDRLSQSMQELIRLVDDLRCRDLNFKVIHGNLDTSRPGGQLILNVFAALAGILHELIASRTRKGLTTARRQGKVGGRPTVMTAEKIAAARALLPDSSIATIARELGVSRGTLYAHMDALKPQAS